MTKKATNPKTGNNGPTTDGHGEKHGLHLMRRAMKRLGNRAIDRRTKVGRALEAFRAEIIEDKGGEDALSGASKALVDTIVRQKLILDSIDAYVLSMGSLVNRKRRAIYPIVRERQQIADALAKYLGMLGLERRVGAVPTLENYIESRYGGDGGGK